MSDTDEDSVPKNVLTFPRVKTALFHQFSNIRSFTSGHSMISNFNQPNHYKGFGQKSMYSRRETSPMSLKSFPNSRMQYRNSYYQSNLSSRGSVYNRSKSPMSVRSIDSNVSAADIAFAFKNVKFNKYDLRMIKDAYNSYMKNRVRRRIQKKRNLKSFIKQCRRKSGGESGVEGSDSSVSGDDCRSTRSAFYKENIPRIKTLHQRTNINSFTTQPESSNDVYTDCTDKFKQHSLRRSLNTQSRSVNNSAIPHSGHQKLAYNTLQTKTHSNRYNEIPENLKDNERCADRLLNITHHDQHKEHIQNSPPSTLSQRERFATNSLMLLPCQRFKIKNNNMKPMTNIISCNEALKSKPHSENKGKLDSDSESDEIFTSTKLNMTLPNSTQLRRTLEDEDIRCPKEKRRKFTVESKNVILTNPKNNDFNFKKPQLPIRKMGISTRDTDCEVLIAKSSQPIVGNVEPTYSQIKEISQSVSSLEEGEKSHINKEAKQLSHNDMNTKKNNTPSEATHNSTDVSMKPSFIKRKLFTQTLDIVENKNTSSDNSDVNSPQTRVVRTCREKNKVRKLTSQSCLSHEILGDNNFLDLIHKIVPPDQINITCANKKDVNKSRINKDDKWDIISAISMCKDDDASETFTDEEIFNIRHETNKQPKQINEDVKRKTKLTKEKQKTQDKMPSQCKVVVEKMTTSNLGDYNTKQNATLQNKGKVTQCVSLFWGTDLDSDVEDNQKKNYGSQIQMNSSNNLPHTNNSKRNGLFGTSFSRLRNMKTSFDNKSDVSHSLKDQMYDNINEKNNNTSTKNISLQSKTKEAIDISNSSIDSKSKTNNQKIKKQAKTTTKASLNKIARASPKLNISRESLRLRHKNEVQTNFIKSTPPNVVGNKSSRIQAKNKLNTSRESIRLKEKREKKQLKSK